MHAEIVAHTLKVNAIDAEMWLDRIESYDQIDWSEWSSAQITKHIKNFKVDWETIYSKALGV